MKKNNLISKSILIFAVILMFSTHTMIFAQDCTDPTLPNGDVNPNYPCPTSGNNPVTGITGNPITSFLNNVINFLIGLGSIVGVVFLVIAGFYFVTARGDDRKIEKARIMVLWVIIGIGIIFISKSLIFIVSQFTGNTGSSSSN